MGPAADRPWQVELRQAAGLGRGSALRASVPAGAGLALHRRLLLSLSAGVIALTVMPIIVSPYYGIVLSEALVLAIACLGLNLLLGNTGLLSLGHAAYFGVGAYTGGFLFTFLDVGSLEAYLLSGVLASTALAALFGFLCVRATRIHFTILTLAFAQLVHSLFIAGIIFRLAGGVGRGLFLLGYGGLYIPRMTLLGIDFAPDLFNTVLYYVIVAAFGVSVGLTWLIVNSPFGKALRAIRENDVRAECIGIPVRTYRWMAFIISGAFTGLAGGLFGPLDRQVTPEQLHWLFSAKLVLAVMLGGSRHFLGPVVGAFAFTALQEVALRVTLYHGLVLGLLLITVVLAFPGGLVGAGIVFVARLRGFSSRVFPTRSSGGSRRPEAG